MLEAAIILETFIVVQSLTFIVVQCTSLPTKPYNQHTGLGLRQPLLITVKTLPHTYFKIKYKGKLTLRT